MGVGAALSVRVTGTVCGVLVAPEAVTVTVAVCVPAAKPEMLTPAVMEPFPLPEVGPTVNQAALSLTLQLSVPEPEFDTAKVWFAGLDPPCMAEKDRAVGLKPIVGVGAEVTENVTATV